DRCRELLGLEQPSPTAKKSASQLMLETTGALTLPSLSPWHPGYSGPVTSYRSLTVLSAGTTTGLIMIIICQQRISLPSFFGSQFRASVPVCSGHRSSPSGNPFAAARSLSHSMNSPTHSRTSRAHPQARGLMPLHDFGLQRIPLYNPHRTR